jgi:hypothetical protein
MMPNHNERTPVKPSEISKVVLDVSNVELIIAGNTAVSPIKTSFTKAITKAIRKKAIQMLLSTILRKEVTTALQRSVFLINCAEAHGALRIIGKEGLYLRG